MYEFRRFFRSRSILFFLPLLLIACVGDIDPFFSFNFQRQFSGSIPVSSSGIDTTFRFNIVDTADEFLNRQTSRELIESAIVTKLGVLSTQALDGIDSVEYFISTDTLPQLHLATVQGFTSAPEFVIDPADTNLVQYFKQPAFNLDVHVMGSKPIASELPLTFEQVFFIVAQPR